MYNTIEIGKVSDNQDPDGLHRIRVTLTGGSVSGWIPCGAALVAREAGLWALPDMDTQVLVLSFDELGLRQAALAGIWSEALPPPSTGENTGADLNQDGTNALHFMQSKSGSALIFDDTEGAEKIQIIGADKKSRIEFLKADELVRLESETDLVISAKKVFSISAECIELNTEKETVFSTEGFSIDVKKALDISADKDITIKGSGVSFN
jgi:phage baseplate assembly protein gpV